MSFKYFAYASNLLTERMHVNCPSAVKKCIAVLKDYELVFTGHADTWKGSTATVIEKPGDCVWGVVWEIAKEHQECLDRQEVGYQPLSMVVETPEKEQITCRIYQRIPPEDERNPLPSTVYKTVMITGATEHGLPKEYIEKFKNFKDNGYRGAVSVPINIKV